MSNSNEDQNTTSKNTNKENNYKLIPDVINQSNLVNINQQQSYTIHLQNQLNLSLKNNTSSQNNTKGNIIPIMQEMQTKISNNDYKSIKELLKNSSTIKQSSKNQLLNLSFSKYNLTNNSNQKKIIMELINHGADANYKLQLLDTNEKSKSNNSQLLSNTSIKINPLIYCCLKGDYELFELIKNKVNLSTSNEESTNNHNNPIYNKNYMFYFFENNSNMENKYKIASDIFSIIKNKNTNNNEYNIDVNEYDKQSGMTLLMLSVIKQYINFINLFLENGADINRKNIKDGNTALHYAARVKNKDIIEILLNNNNILNKPNKMEYDI